MHIFYLVVVSYKLQQEIHRIFFWSWFPVKLTSEVPGSARSVAGKMLTMLTVNRANLTVFNIVN